MPAVKNVSWLKYPKQNIGKIEYELKYLDSLEFPDKELQENNFSTLIFAEWKTWKQKVFTWTLSEIKNEMNYLIYTAGII